MTALDTNTGARRLEPAARPPRHLGPRHQCRADAGRHRQGRADHPGAGADLQAGLPLRAQPRDRRAGLSDRGAAGPGLDRAGRDRLADAALCGAARAVVEDTLAGRLPARRCGRPRLLQRGPRRACVDEGRFTPPSLEGSLVYPGTIGGVEWGGGAVDPRSGIFVVNYSSARADLPADPARPTTTRARNAGRSRPAGSSRMTGSPYGIQLTDLPQPARHAVLEAALRLDRRLRPEDRRAALGRAVRAGAAVRLLHARDRGARSPSAGR